MKKLLPLLLLCCALLGANAQTYQINYEDTTRNFIVHVPPSYTAGQHLPMVFNLHGYTSNAIQQQVYSGMDATADANNFIVVYPNGLGNAWNSGFSLPYNGTFPDDVGFLSKIIDTMTILYDIDLTRVYSCGMSNGGFQSYRLACDLENRIAAIASVTGSMTTIMTSNCSLSRRVPVLQIHGTMDPTVPYAGAAGVLGQEALINFWVDKNSCSAVNDTTDVPNTNTTDNSTAQKIKYRTCNSGTQVWFFKMINGAHTWPGSGITIGTTNKDINASQEIWDFFNQYTINGPVTAVEEVKAKVEMNIFPNPANNVLNVEASEYIKQVTVYNLLGEKVMSRNLSSSNAQLNIAELHSGIYMLSIQAGGNTYTKRFTKE